MNRPVLGLLLGGVVGFLDGGTAKWTSPEPEYQAALMGIMMGSAFKGLLGGLITGFVARKTGSIGFGIAVGLGVAIAFATLISYLNFKGDLGMYWRIIAPGAVTGIIVGYTIVRYGKPSGGVVAS